MSALLISACNRPEAPPKKPPPPQGTVFDGMISQKERARKGVEDAMEKNKEKLEQSMKQNEVATPAE